MKPASDTTTGRELLCAEDLRVIDTLSGAFQVDPGVKTEADVAAMTPVDRLIWQDELDSWHSWMPFFPTREAVLAIKHVSRAVRRSPRSEYRQIPFFVLGGDPGTGKTQCLQQVHASQMLRMAATRAARISQGLERPGDVVRPGAVYRPVLRMKVRGQITERQLFADLCGLLGWPYDSDPQVAFIAGTRACGTRLVLLDEIQFVSFQGATGRKFHDALKAITNEGVTLVIAGHNLTWLYEEQDTPIREAARQQSLGRGVGHTIRKLGYATPADRAQYRALLAGIENHVRLPGHPPGQPWLSGDLADYLWVSTLGYMNSLVTLITDAIAFTLAEGLPEVTREVLENTDVELRAQQGRDRRVQLFDAGRFDFAS